MPDNFFKTIEDSYLTRCNNSDQQKGAWRAVIKAGFFPDLTSETETRANILLAKKSGDLGLALTWIVQAALINPILGSLKNNPDLTEQQHKMFKSVTKDMCGALAHSEPDDDRLTVEASEKILFLNGTKKYITGGTNADFIFLTGRKPEDEKTSLMLWLLKSDIEPDEMEILDMGSLLTSSHGRLTFRGKKLPASCILPVEPSRLRRMLAVWGIVERTLIMETFLALLIYIRKKTGMTDNEQEFAEVMSKQQKATSKVISAAYAGNRVNFPLENFEQINHIAKNTIPTALSLKDISQEMFLKIEDADFIWSFWNRK